MLIANVSSSLSSISPKTFLHLSERVLVNDSIVLAINYLPFELHHPCIGQIR